MTTLRTVPYVALVPRPIVNFVLATAVDVERDEMLSHLVPIEGEDAVLKVPCDSHTYFVGRCGLYNVALVKSEMGATGPSGAHEVIGHALRTWKAYAVISVGIAFGAGGADQQLGDVLVSRMIIPYDHEKVSKSGRIPRAPHPEAGGTLVNRISNLFWRWTPIEGGPPRSPILGTLLCGSKLVNELKYKTRLFKQHPTAIGGEMEGAGIWGAATAGRVEWVVVKAICDWGFDKASEPQPLAARNACALVKALLQEPGLDPVDFGRTSNPVASDHRLETTAQALAFTQLSAAIRDSNVEVQRQTTDLLRFVETVPLNADGSAQLRYKPDADLLQAGLAAGNERMLNAYNDAAARYLSGDIDKAQFRSAFATEIVELFEEDGPPREILETSGDAYHALRRAYEEFTANSMAADTAGPEPIGKLAQHRRSEIADIGKQGSNFLGLASERNLQSSQFAFKSWARRVTRLSQDPGLRPEDAEALVWPAELFSSILSGAPALEDDMLRAIRGAAVAAERIAAHYDAADDRSGTVVEWERKLLQATFDCFRADGDWPLIDDSRLATLNVDIRLAVATLPQGFAQLTSGRVRLRWPGLLACDDIKTTYDLCEAGLAYFKGRLGASQDNVRITVEELQSDLRISQTDANKLIDLFADAPSAAGHTPGRSIAFARGLIDYVDLWHLVGRHEPIETR